MVLVANCRRWKKLASCKFMSQNKSFRLRYVGTRFEGKRLPVDVLTDLPALGELVVAFAKSEWRRLNEDRKRVPRGFDASLAFDLVWE